MSQILAKLLELLLNAGFITIVQPDQVAVLVRFGRFKRSLAGGFYWKWPLLDTVRKTPCKDQSIDLKNQHVQSQQGITYAISGYILYRVIDAQKDILEVHDYDVSLPRYVMHEIASAVSIPDNEPRMRDIEQIVSESISDQAEHWGLDILEFGLTDFSRAKVIRLVQEGGKCDQ